MGVAGIEVVFKGEPADEPSDEVGEVSELGYGCAEMADKGSCCGRCAPGMAGMGASQAFEGR